MLKSKLENTAAADMCMCKNPTLRMWGKNIMVADSGNDHGKVSAEIVHAWCSDKRGHSLGGSTMHG